MNAVACIQARLGSTRLPGKILELIGGVPALGHTVARAEAAGYITWVLCPIGDFAAIKNAMFTECNLWAWDGPEDDVLGRFRAFANQRLDVDVFIRLTGDCPWVDVETIRAVAGLVTSGAADFADTTGLSSINIDGYDVEAFTRGLLLEAQAEVSRISKGLDDNGAFYREHVTPLIQYLSFEHWLCNRVNNNRRRRWTLDTPEDLEWFRAVAKEIDVTPPNHPTYRELMELEERCPELRR